MKLCLLPLLLLFFTSSIDSLKCPNHSDQIPNENVCIYAINETDFYYEAIRKCALLEPYQRKYWIPAKIQNLYENSFIFSYIIPGELNGVAPYIGLERDKDGTWTYADGSPLAYQNWAKDEPNNSSDRNACAIMSNETSKWISVECTVARPYICSIDETGTTVKATETTTAFISTTPRDEFCTRNARLDIMFMIDGCFSNQSDIDLVYDVLTNFYDGLAMNKNIGNSSYFCQDKSQWNQWNARVTGETYYNDTYKGLVPQFCQDQSAQLASIVKTLTPGKLTVTSMRTIVNRTSIFMETEKRCVCRRGMNESNPDYNVDAKQIMIWLPLTPKYTDEANEFQRTHLYSFDHYLLPYKFSQKDANVDPNSIWTKMTEIKLTTPTSRTEIVQALWDLVCDITGAPGERPIAPNDWQPF